MKTTVQSLIAKGANKITVRWNEHSAASVKRAERNKALLENAGWKLVEEKAGLSWGQLTYSAI